MNLICGHDPRYIVQTDDGTAFCAACEREALLNQVAEHEKAKKMAQLVIKIKGDEPGNTLFGYNDPTQLSACGHRRNLIVPFSNEVGTVCLACMYQAEHDERIRLEERLKHCQALLSLERDEETKDD